MHQMRTWFLVGLTATLGLVSCGPKARIVGEVHDGFGKPLAGVAVSIPNTAFQTMSGSSGKYTLPFAPGKFSVAFAKADYSSYNLAQDVSVETTVPLALVTLYKRPQEQAIWLCGSSDYVQVRQGRLATSGADRKNFAWVYQMSYRVAGDFTKVPRQKAYQFMDNFPAPLALLKVSDQGVLATRSEGFMGMGDTRGTVIKEETKEVADGMTLREVLLEPGRYAYVKLDRDPVMGMNTGRIAAPVFPFEVR
jgi:hypothetical protein